MSDSTDERGGGKRGRPFPKGRSGNPAGRPKGRGKRQDGAGARGAGRADGWVNLLSGLGSALRDKRVQTNYQADVIDDATAREFWLGNDIAARIVETVPEEMLRAGWDLDLATEDDDEEEAVGEALDLSERTVATCEEIGLEGALETALKYERAYGGAAILPILNDGQKDLSQPLNIDAVMSLSHFLVLEPRECQANSWQGDLLDPNFAEPETYRVAPITRGQVAPSSVIVHRSRLCVFRGIRVSRHQIHTARPSWGGSVLSRVNVVLRDFGVAWESVGALLQEISLSVYKVKGLADIVAQDDKRLFEQRLLAIDLAKSVIRGIVIDAEEEHQRQGLPMTGIPEVLQQFAVRLAAAADMPVTLLMGISPAGLNATGESDRAFFYDRVARRQRVHLRPKLEWLLKLMFRARRLGPDGDLGFSDGQEPELWSVKFRPLWQPSEKERAEVRKLIADADAIWIDRGVLLPQEVALSRFGGDAFSDTTTIDTATRKKMLELELAAQEEQATAPPPPAAGQLPPKGGQAGPPEQPGRLAAPNEAEGDEPAAAGA